MIGRRTAEDLCEDRRDHEPPPPQCVGCIKFTPPEAESRFGAYGATPRVHAECEAIGEDYYDDTDDEAQAWSADDFSGVLDDGNYCPLRVRG